MPGQLTGKAAIVGIGATDFSKNSGRSELRLAAEAVLDALDDAGLAPGDVDGMVTFTMDSNTEVAVARATGIGELKFFSKIHHGGGAACATIQQAAIAVATGVAECVVAYRAFNERSGMRFGQVQMRLVENADSTGVDNSFSYPHGLSTPAAQVAMIAKRYMHLSGATSKDFGAVSVADRKHAAKNPKAYFYEKPITIEDHQNSRWIAEPLRLLDCCQETDGGVALVVTTPERAKDLRHRPAIIEAASQGSSPDQYSMVSYYRPELGLPEMGLVGRQLWQQSGLKPTDIQTAILYDHFTPFTLIQLEELGFCGQGDAKDYIADGAIEIGGRLPINTHGGQLGEAYIHGMNGIAEGVRQLRGTSVNPVPDVTSTFSTSSTWLQEVPRTWRTPSVMPFMPWMYASPSRPPLVLMGSAPPRDRFSIVAKSLASPRPQNPSSSSCEKTNGVKWSYRKAVWMSCGPRAESRQSFRATTPISGRPVMSSR